MRWDPNERRLQWCSDARRKKVDPVCILRLTAYFKSASISSKNRIWKRVLLLPVVSAAPTFEPIAFRNVEGTRFKDRLAINRLAYVVKQIKTPLELLCGWRLKRENAWSHNIFSSRSLLDTASDMLISGPPEAADVRSEILKRQHGNRGSVYYEKGASKGVDDICGLSFFSRQALPKASC